jgi:hypothetical protein
VPPETEVVPVPKKKCDVCTDSVNVILCVARDIGVKLATEALKKSLDL